MGITWQQAFDQTLIPELIDVIFYYSFYEFVVKFLDKLGRDKEIGYYTDGPAKTREFNDQFFESMKEFLGKFKKEDTEGHFDLKLAEYECRVRQIKWSRLLAKQISNFFDQSVCYSLVARGKEKYSNLYRYIA